MHLTQSAYQSRPTMPRFSSCTGIRSIITGVLMPGAPVTRTATGASRRRGVNTPSVVIASAGAADTPPVSGSLLPNGVWWLDPASVKYDVVYGSNGSFVLQRPRSGGPGLVHMPAAPLARRLSQRQELGITLGSVLDQPVGLARLRLDEVSIMEGGMIIDTDFEVIEEGVELLSLPPSTCLGIVRVETPVAEPTAVPEDEDVYIFESSTDNPRRTKKVKFTCNLCGATTIRPVNPHAWTSGSVFGRCGGCSVIHMLTDHLKVFHELKGSVYPAAWVKARSVVIPPGLPQSPGADLEQLPSGYRIPSVEN